MGLMRRQPLTLGAGGPGTATGMWSAWRSTRRRKRRDVRRMEGPATGRSLFRCPDCRGPLHDLACPVCGGADGTSDGIPDLLGGGPLAQRCREIGAYYDALYTSRTDVWREQGHTDEFTRYIVDLVDAAGAGRYLDVGCGEGLFLAEVQRVGGVRVGPFPPALLRAPGAIQGHGGYRGGGEAPVPGQRVRCRHEHRGDGALPRRCRGHHRNPARSQTSWPVCPRAARRDHAGRAAIHQGPGVPLAAASTAHAHAVASAKSPTRPSGAPAADTPPTAGTKPLSPQTGADPARAQWISHGTPHHQGRVSRSPSARSLYEDLLP